MKLYKYLEYNYRFAYYKEFEHHHFSGNFNSFELGNKWPENEY